jgi:hypothetical protein
MTAYRDDVSALAARHQALTAELKEKTAEVAEAAQLLEEARDKRSLPILDNVRVASPCSADWNQMVGDDRARACASCQKTVYNLSELTRYEAESLILEKAGQLCARYYQRKDGTILLQDCTIGASRKRKRRLLAAGAAALLAGGAGTLAHQLLPSPEPCGCARRDTLQITHGIIVPTAEPEEVPEQEAAAPEPALPEEEYSVIQGDISPRSAEELEKLRERFKGIKQLKHLTPEQLEQLRDGPLSDL